MSIRGFIFDLDGLMVDSEPLGKRAWQVYLDRFGCVLDDATINAMFGLRRQDSARLVQQTYQLPLSVEQVMAQELELLMEMLQAENLQPMPGLHQLLQAIDRREMPRAVATSSGRRYAPLALAAIGAADGFDVVLTGDDVLNGKPAPDIYLAAAAELDLAPQECMVFEDAPHGVRAAKAAGMCCIAVPNALTADLDLSAADRIYPSLAVAADDLDLLVQLG